MTEKIKPHILKAYTAFNRRDIDAALSTFHPDVEWPKAFEGGYVTGHDAVRGYWNRQWSEIDPEVIPVDFAKRDNETVMVRVHQKVKDLQGTILFDGFVNHIYTIEDGLLRRMDIEA